jgi:hypothetical protein
MGEGVGGEGSPGEWGRGEDTHADITPEPTPAELAAILIALDHLNTNPKPTNQPTLSPWAAAGRRESLLGLTAGSRGGWGHARDGKSDR